MEQGHAAASGTIGAPKRPVAGVKRPVASASAATKSLNTTSSLSKPPTRPSTTSTIKKSVTATSNTSPHKPRPSLFKTADSKPVVSSTRSTATDQRPPSALKGSIGNARVRVPASAAGPRAIRPGTTVSGGKSEPNGVHQQAKPTRPPLGIRKSTTMSINLEQHLHELELVQQMLRAAMSEEGDKDDESKEEYTSRMDESLALLKGKIQEARRSEGKDQLPIRTDDSVTEDEGSKISQELEAKLTASQERASTLEENLAALHAEHTTKLEELSVLHQAELTKMSSEQLAKQVEKVIQDIRQEHAAEIEKINASHAAELGQLHTQPQTKDDQVVLARVNQEHASKIENLIASHEKDLDQLRAINQTADTKIDELVATQALAIKTSEEAQKKLIQEHASKVEGLIGSYEKDLAHLQAINQTAETKVEVLSTTHAMAIKNSEEALEKLSQGNASKIEGLIASYEKDLADLRSINQTVETKIKELTETDTLTTESHEEALKSLGQEHSAKVEDLIASHARELADLRTMHQTAEERFEKLTTTHTRTVESHEEVLKSLSQEHSAKVEDLITSQGKEIIDLRTTYNTAETRIEELTVAHAQTIESHKADLERLSQEHASQIEDLTALHRDELARSQAIVEQADQKANELNAKHESEIERLQTELEQMEEARLVTVSNDHGDQKELIKSLEDRLSAEEAKGLDLISKLDRLTHDATELKAALEDNNASSTQQLESVKLTLSNQLTEAEEASTSQLNKMKADYDILLDDKDAQVAEKDKTIMEVRNELEEHHATHKKGLATIESSHAAYINALESERAELLDAKDQEIGKLEDVIGQLQDEMLSSHGNRLQQLDASKASLIQEHESIILNLRNEHQAELDVIRLQSEAVHLDHITELKTQHGTVIQKLQNELKASSKILQGTRQQNSAAHETELSELRTAHAKELDDCKDLIAKHVQSTLDLQDQIIQERKALADVEHQLLSAKTDFVQAKAELEVAEHAQQQDKVTIERLAAAAAEANNVIADTSKEDDLRQQIEELTAHYESKVAELEEGMKVEDAKREQERKSGAEVRDRLAQQLAELEPVRQELTSAQSMSEAARASLRDAETRFNESLSAEHARSKQLATELQKAREDAQAVSKAAEESVRATEARFKERNEQLMTDLHKVQEDANSAAAELERLKAEHQKFERRRSRSHSTIRRDMDALQIIADDMRMQNDKLKVELESSRDGLQRETARVRELEAALKVTSAEITELKTKRMDSEQAVPLSPAPQGGLRTSRWAAGEKSSVEGTQLGAQIQGAMAGLQEQLRQLEEVNTSMIEGHQRAVDRISRPSSNGSGSENRRPTSKGSDKFVLITR